ncbi:MAG: FecR family protein [Flavisolibacter sp.]
MKKQDLHITESELQNAHRIAYLIVGHIRKTLAPPEQQELDKWVGSSEKNVRFFEEMTDPKNLQQTLAWQQQLQTEEALQRVHKKISLKSRTKKTVFSLQILSIAAAIILLGVAGFLILQQNHTSPAAHPTAALPPSSDIAPGSYTAVLTLSGGKKIVLGHANNVPLAIEGNTEIIEKDSLLSYNSKPNLGIAEKTVFNTLTTPVGGTYSAVLPDGSRVWLNASSSLTYPTAFRENQREVTLTGEAYFEVSKNPKRPFLVQTGTTTITVLGTHFNINGYGDESGIRTTLLEGSVKVLSSHHTALLSPGEEAISNNAAIVVHQTDTRSAVAWKEGIFQFMATPMPTVLKNLERWYGITVENKEANNKHLTATISRNVPLSQVLHLMEGTGDIHFTLEGKKLIVHNAP